MIVLKVIVIVTGFLAAGAGADNVIDAAWRASVICLLVMANSK